MTKRQLLHHFSLAGDFPSFMYSIDNIGNKYVEIELVKDLCTTRGRIAGSSFVFEDIPSCPPDVLSEDFFYHFFNLMNKLALCFEYMSIEHICMLLRIDKSPDIDAAKHLRYNIIDGLIDMHYGPAIMYMHNTANARERYSTESMGNMIQGLVKISKRRAKYHGYYVRSLNKLREGKSCNPVISRSILEYESTIPHININGLSLVLESEVEKIKPGYIEQHRVMNVNGIGRGVPLIDLIQSDISLTSWYNIKKKLWGPLYPSIITDETSKSHVIVPDYIPCDG